MDTDQTAELRHDLARFRNLLALCADEKTCEIIRALIAETRHKLEALKQAA
jgi:hypothetical protein